MAKIKLQEVAEQRARAYRRDAAAAMKRETAPEERLHQLQQAVGKIVMLPVDEIIISENVRRDVEHNPEFEALILSVAEDGVRQSLQVELRGGDNNYQLICVAGQRRIMAVRAARAREELRAAAERRAPQIEKLQRVPALLLEYSDDTSRTLDGLIENMLRQDLPPIDIACGYARLRAGGYTEPQISERFGRAPRTVRKYLRIADYPPEAHELIRSNPGLFTSTVLLNEFASRQFTDNEALITALKQFIIEHESTAPESIPAGQGSETASATKPKHKKSRQPGTEFSRKVEQRIRAALPLKISVFGQSNRGKVTFVYRSQEELELLLTTLEQGRKKSAK